jgi:hypothetical protein
MPSVSPLPTQRFVLRPQLQPSDSFGAVPEGAEFAARVHAAINARDRAAIRALSTPGIIARRDDAVRYAQRSGGA